MSISFFLQEDQILEAFHLCGQIPWFLKISTASMSLTPWLPTTAKQQQLLLNLLLTIITTLNRIPLINTYSDKYGRANLLSEKEPKKPQEQHNCCFLWFFLVLSLFHYFNVTFAHTSSFISGS